MRGSRMTIPLMLRIFLLLSFLPSLATATPAAAAGQAEAGSELATRWAEEVDLSRPHPEYPRPQMSRAAWLNLNGAWNYAVRPWGVVRPQSWDGDIVVPFPIESKLSGVARRLQPKERLWYQRSLTVPEGWSGKQLLLHFGAIDWHSRVWWDGEEVGGHLGGYDPFTCKIPAALSQPGEHQILVAAVDPTDDNWQPRGKQVRQPHGIWYTPSSGIWQTVWLEAVPSSYFADLKIDASFLHSEALVRTAVEGWHPGLSLRADVMLGPVQNSTISGAKIGYGPSPSSHQEFTLPIPVHDAQAWSPSEPLLYTLRLRLFDGDEVVDEVNSYFGLRDIERHADEHGVQRLFLNGEALFHYGTLDQGFWPDGLYTAPSDAALRYDLEMTKALGFNMVRKHVKVEPDRWYYWCDRIGLMVWQDMPSGDRYIGGNDPDIERESESEDNFWRELRALVDDFGSHPCIVMWVPFNEGWGQWRTQEVSEWLKQHDPTRLVNSASGWTDRGCGDVHDVHSYPGPAMPPLEDGRAAVLGEFGGLGLPLAGHTWQTEKNWGYRSYPDSAALTDAYVQLIARLRPLIAEGLSAAVYTQTTDVEIEVNGLMTYDREVLKMSAERVRAANLSLFLPPPQLRTVLPCAPQQAQTWKYQTEDPGPAWMLNHYDDAAWSQGQAGFGTAGTPGAVIGTPWNGAEIWLRQEFEHTPVAGDDAGAEEGTLHLRIHHDEDAEVFLNGVRIARLSGYTTSYVLLPLDEHAGDPLHPGRNLLAIHCQQTGGGQYIDAGLVRVLAPVAD